MSHGKRPPEIYQYTVSEVTNLRKFYLKSALYRDSILALPTLAITGQILQTAISP